MNKQGLHQWLPEKNAEPFFGLNRKKEPIRFKHTPTRWEQFWQKVKSLLKK